MLNDYLLILTINTLWNQNEKNILVNFLTDFEKKTQIHILKIR